MPGREFVDVSLLVGAKLTFAHAVTTDADGTRDGFDISFTRAVATAVTIPVIASGGAGRPEHFLQVFTEGSAAAALGAGMFHDGTYTVGDVKRYLQQHGVMVRPC